MYQEHLVLVLIHYQLHTMHSGKGIDLYLARMTLFYLDDSLHGHSFHESHRKDLSLNA